ncbi:rRNA maturation RNase YbeY [Palleronia caenipelagi]|uniref:Endoribonuclease YbeY n=1 Tax=Palleronia caenipelagi TaxID=2489174 RepID=A0A547PRJ1_9RHOB|nr:rRNA maturation RNase YbeY [Palleronia caenipelagi]TRD16664.1 rRNA maturation RNase YbeY [Palleronia caenipelagi]
MSDFTVDVVFEDPRWEEAGLEDWAGIAARATAAHLGLDEVEMVVLGCDDARIAELNADFRGKPQPTNVLSWPSEERGAEAEGGAPLPPEDPEIGDIALAWETMVAEAEAAGISLHNHSLHLIIHGMLHLLGYDHIRDGDAELMELLETQILATLGVAPPYERD